MTLIRQFFSPCRGRKGLALLVIAGLFMQWAVGIGVSIESENSVCCPTSGCAAVAAQPSCSLSLPPEDSLAVASIFYQAGILPAPAPELAGAASELIFALPIRIRAASRAILRRPPR